MPWTGRRAGVEGWTRFFAAIGANADEMTVQMEPFAAEGDRVVAVGRYQGVVKATGKRIDSPLAHLWTFRDGKVVRCQEFANTALERDAFQA